MEWQIAVVLLVAVSAFTQISHGAAPVFTTPLADQHGVENGIVSFICRATGTPPLSFRWMKGDKRAKGGRITEVDIENGSVLRIVLLRTPRDQGLYQCIVTDGDGEDARSEARLMIYEENSLPAGFPSIERMQNVEVVEKYRQARLECRASGNPVPEIQWYRDNIPLVEGGRLHVTEQVLTIDTAEESDQGSFQCMATNSAGTRFSEPTNLYVRERRTPPQITLINSTIEVLPGSTFKIHCVAAGSPMPEVKWLVEGVEVGEEDADPKIAFNTYTVQSIQESVNYTCLATSTQGIAESKLEIIVKTRPRAPVPPVVGLVTANTISLTWSAPGKAPMESYVLMYKDASSTGSFEVVEGITSPSYSVEELEPFTEYIFKIAAVNAIGRGDPSGETRQRTGELAPSSPPREVRARPISASTIFIQWAPPRKPNGVIQGYNVYYTTKPSQVLSAWFKHAVPADNERVTTISDLTTMQIYTISISAYTSVGEGPASDHIQVKTQQGVPGQPENFAGEAISPTEIQLTWGMRANVPITRYELYFNTSSSDAEEEHRVIPTGTNYVLDNLSPNTLYHIRLAARSQNGVGASTPVISIRTEQSVPSEPPRDIVGTAVDSTSFSITWNPPPEESKNGVLISNKILYTKISLGNAVPFEDQSSMTIEVDAPLRTHVIENLDKWTVYEIKMAAATIRGDGPWSTSISAQTDEDDLYKYLEDSETYEDTIKIPFTPDNEDTRIPCFPKEQADKSSVNSDSTSKLLEDVTREPVPSSSPENLLNNDLSVQTSITQQSGCSSESTSKYLVNVAEQRVSPSSSDYLVNLNFSAQDVLQDLYAFTFIDLDCSGTTKVEQQIYIGTTSNNGSSGKIFFPSQNVSDIYFVLNAGEGRFIQLPESYQRPYTDDSGLLLNKTVVVAANDSIVVYAYQGCASRSGKQASAFRVHEIKRLRTDYWVLTYFGDTAAHLGIVAVEENTSVAISFNHTNGDVTMNEQGIMLNKYDAFYLVLPFDASGTRITSSKNVSVIVGVKSITVPSHSSNFEPFCATLEPFSNWGRSFSVSHFLGPEKSNDYIVKFLSAVDNNTVQWKRDV